MVLYFTSAVVSPAVVLYMGKDKFENEELIKYGWEEDVWFHVDKMSSAHVYLRLPKGMAWDAIPEELLQDIAQLTKANSIEGNKKNNITILYTPWANLKKTPGMETGQVTFHKATLVKKVYVKEKVNEIVNRLNKTKVEAFPDLEMERIAKNRVDREEKRVVEKKKKQDELEKAKERKQLAEMKSYAGVFDEENMSTTNRRWQNADGSAESVRELEEDFM